MEKQGIRQPNRRYTVDRNRPKNDMPCHDGDLVFDRTDSSVSAVGDGNEEKGSHGIEGIFFEGIKNNRPVVSQDVLSVTRSDGARDGGVPRLDTPLLSDGEVGPELYVSVDETNKRDESNEKSLRFSDSDLSYNINHQATHPVKQKEVKNIQN